MECSVPVGNKRGEDIPISSRERSMCSFKNLFCLMFGRVWV